MNQAATWWLEPVSEVLVCSPKRVAPNSGSIGSVTPLLIVMRSRSCLRMGSSATSNGPKTMAFTKKAKGIWAVILGTLEAMSIPQSPDFYRGTATSTSSAARQRCYPMVALKAPDGTHFGMHRTVAL